MWTYDYDSDVDSSLEITFILTENGKRNVPTIISNVFSYLKLLEIEGPNEELWQDMKTMDDIDFNFYQEPSALTLVERLADRMRIVPDEDLFSQPYLKTYDSNLIKSCLNHLAVDNVCVILYSKDYLNDCNELEQYHKVKYSIEDIPTDWLTPWKQASIMNEFNLRTRNQFIPKDLSLKECENVPKFPIRLINELHGELFFKYDNVFNQPKGFFKFNIALPQSNDGKNVMMKAIGMNLFLRCFDHYIKENKTWGTFDAGLSWNTYGSSESLTIYTSGYNDKMITLLQTLLVCLKDFKANFDRDIFQTELAQYKKDWFNTIIDPDRTKSGLDWYIMSERYL